MGYFQMADGLLYGSKGARCFGLLRFAGTSTLKTIVAVRFLGCTHKIVPMGLGSLRERFEAPFLAVRGPSIPCSQLRDVQVWLACGGHLNNQSLQDFSKPCSFSDQRQTIWTDWTNRSFLALEDFFSRFGRLLESCCTLSCLSCSWLKLMEYVGFYQWDSYYRFWADTLCSGTWTLAIRVTSTRNTALVLALLIALPLAHSCSCLSYCYWIPKLRTTRSNPKHLKRAPKAMTLSTCGLQALLFVLHLGSGLSFQKTL